MDLWQDYFDEPRGANMGRLQAMYAIGSIVSLPFAPILCDKWGRKVSIITGCVIMVIASALQTASTAQPMFEGKSLQSCVHAVPSHTLTGARFFLGFGNSFAQLASPLLLTELCHPQHRGRVTAIYNCLWHAGSILCAWLTFGTMRISNQWCWRAPTLVQGVFSMIQLAFIWWVPESPRWLISKDRTEEALSILTKYHANGHADDPTVQFEYAEIKETLRLEFLYKKSSSYFDFFKTPGNRYRLGLILSLGFFSQMSGNSLLSYYSNRIYDSVGIDDNNTRFGLNGGRSILDLIVSISCAMAIDKVGRRPLFLTATSGMLLWFTGMTILGNRYSESPTKGIGIGFVTFQWLFSISYALAWSGLLVGYTVEVLPFKLRAKGLMIMNMTVQAALAFSGQVHPIPLDGAWKGEEWKLYCVYTCWIAVELTIVYFYYVETKYALSTVYATSPLTNNTGDQLLRKLPRFLMVAMPLWAWSRRTESWAMRRATPRPPRLPSTTTTTGISVPWNNRLMCKMLSCKRSVGLL